MISNAIDPSSCLSSRPFYALLVQFPAVCFSATLVTDITYWRTELFIWETFSIWLLTAGCILAGLTAIVGLIDFIYIRRIRISKMAWLHAIASLLAVLLSVINAFVHSRDGYVAVVPDGLALSGIVVVIMIFVSWMGWPFSRINSRVGAA